MLQRGDVFVYVLIVLIIVVWLWKPWRGKKVSASNDVPKTGKMVELLEAEGYELVSGKVKIPLTLYIGERETDTVVTGDCLVKQHGRTYIVQTEREEGQSLTAKRVKEHYLSACLAFHTDGVIVLNADKTRLKHVDIAIKPPFGRSRFRLGLICFLLGAGITFFWLY